MAKKIVVYIIFIAAIALVTAFGLGPVLYADGTMRERLTVLFVVLVLYAVLITLFMRFRKGIKNKV